MKRYLALILLVRVSACDGGAMPQATPDLPVAVDLAMSPAPSDAAQPSADAGLIDVDRDGLDDREEARLAARYLPYLSIVPDDGCPLAGILYRLRPHPDAPAKRLHLLVDVLYQKDCGTLGHVGDDEAFGVTIDPSQPPPAGILAVRAIAHQGTACQHVSECGTCMGMSACSTAPSPDGMYYPVVFASKGKHGNYTTTKACDGACFLSNLCALAPKPALLPMQNAGEPMAPMTRDLTQDGFINSANGWTESKLLHFDPWGNTNFGGAGNVTADLLDSAFLTPACM